MTLPQTYLRLKQQPPRNVLITFATVVILLLILAVSSGGTTKLGSFIPHRSHSNGAITSQKQRLLDEISNSTLGFEKIFAINLPERTDHRDGLILASAVSGISIEFIDGVHGESISTKALPAGHDESLDLSRIGSWRAHINAISEWVFQRPLPDMVVDRNLTSALIIEDDVDWDVRLRLSLRDFALSTDALLRAPTTANLNFNHLPSTPVLNESPYGDGWDVLWLGHCGMKLPTDSGLVIHENDVTVPETQYLRSWDVNEPTPLQGLPKHTRVVMHQKEGTCSLAYAVTQSGARRILYSLGLRRLDDAFDLMLRRWCEGTDGEESNICIGVLPQLFDHHRRKGPGNIDSDISAPNSEYRHSAYTNNIRWSVRMNMNKILRGDTSYDDQFPDT